MTSPLDLWDVSHWSTRHWVILGVAVASFLVVLVAGYFVTRRRRRSLGDRPLRVTDPLSDTPARSERRSGARRRGNPLAVLISDADHEVEPVTGWVIDRAPKGFGLEIPEEGEVDPGLVLSVRPTNAPKSVGWVQVVVRSRVKDGPYWRVGVEFVRVPDTSTLLLFG